MRALATLSFTLLLGACSETIDKQEDPPDTEDCTDGVDNNDDGLSDCADPTCAATCDADGDGSVDIDLGGDDCDDNNAAIHPGATEICDDIDNNCDGLIDEDDPSLEPTSWYADNDGDGYGNANQAIEQCDPPPGTSSTDGTDCDDDNPAVHPGATEVCDGIDNNCDGLTDDDDPAVDPATFRTWWVDADGDGHGDPNVEIQACLAPSGHTNNADDCDDGDPAVHPDANEICDGVDNDCDNTVDNLMDRDGDGFIDCGPNPDCDDFDAQIYPGAPELCDGIDNDCDGLLPADENDIDSDGLMVCDGDCDDADPGIGLPAEWFEDLDGDGWGAGVAVGPQCSSPGATYVSYLGDDCDDTDPLIYPGAYDLFGDGVDADCDGRDGACQEIAVGFLPGWGSLNDPSLEWTNLIANAANLGTCPLRVDEVGAGFTLADLQARNLDVLWSGDAAGTSIEYSNTEAQAISDFVNAGGGLVTSYVWSYTTSDNRFLAPLVGIDPTGVIAGTAVAQLPITVLDPTHPIARDVAPNFNLASYAFTQDSNPSLINALLPDTEVIMASTDDSNLLVAFDNGIWRGVAITTFTEYQVSNPNIQQVMYNAAAWAAGYDNP